jgi:cell division protein FtsQ
MARNSGSTIQEELYSTPDEAARQGLEDARLLDLDAEQESPFLRAQKRVPARRSALPKKTASRLFWCALVIAAAALSAVGAASLYQYGEHSWRFRLESSDNIELTGLSNVTRAQIMEVMGGDIGRNIFFIPLDRRQKQLEQIPWVESASVMRFAPDWIRIQIHERTPIAFARVGSKVMLVDSGGSLMELSTKKKYSFPVIIGMSSAEPLSTRATRTKIYDELIRELDSSGGHYSQDLSEVDLSDPEDVKVLANDADGEVLVHLGSSNYLDRFKIYIAHLREWRQQFQKLDSVDLRYDRQIIVNPDLGPGTKQPPISAAAARAAISAGVKPAALLAVQPPKTTPHTILRPALVKHVQKTPHWQKRAASAKALHISSATWTKKVHALTYVSPLQSNANRKTAPAPATATSTARSSGARPQVSEPESPRKPSPAILKGQDSH